jgi:hypothetical protein
MREAKFTKTLTIAISPQLFNEIKLITDKQCISLSEWFRDAAEQFLTNSNEEV